LFNGLRLEKGPLKILLPNSSTGTIPRPVGMKASRLQFVNFRIRSSGTWPRHARPKRPDIWVPDRSTSSSCFHWKSAEMSPLTLVPARSISLDAGPLLR
jgi:hypothetical protein